MQIEMTEYEVQEFAAWLRERGNQYIQRAERIEHIRGNANGTSTTQGTLSAAAAATERPRTSTVTQEQFEQSVMQKSGRVYDVARRLNVDESVITDFLRQPNARVAVAGRGWIKPKAS